MKYTCLTDIFRDLIAFSNAFNYFFVFVDHLHKHYIEKWLRKQK